MANYRTDSLYRNTKIINGQYLDVLDIDNIDIDNTTTKTITLEAKYEEKPDLLAYDLYGNAKLWWVFALFNQDELADPIVDFKTGLKISVPIRFS
jgi:ABC-type Fe3+-hydroxamate transport system substrate-binding protein